MPDLTDLLHDRAAEAPEPRPLTDDLVRRVRRRRAARMAVAGGGTALGAGAVALVAVAALAEPRAARVVVPAVPGTPTASPYDDRYEFCTDAPSTALSVRPWAGTENKYEQGCYVAAAGTPVKLTFSTTSSVPHNVVVKPEGGEPFAKTEDLVAGGQTVDQLGFTLEKGDYVLYCGLHEGMQAQLIAR